MSACSTRGDGSSHLRRAILAGLLALLAVAFGWQLAGAAGQTSHVVKPVAAVTTVSGDTYDLETQHASTRAPLARDALDQIARARRGVDPANAPALTGAAAEATSTGWQVGQPIENLTKAGNSPAWSTVRARYWKNTADDALEGEYGASNLARMQGGKPPLHDELGVPMELNHIIPRWQVGGHTRDNLQPLWPWEHAAVDPFRFYTGPTP